MQVLVWIVIILVVIFLIWLLKRWIKRLIFIIILLVLAFFIYGIFSPSWAAKLWYNVRTFPNRVTSWISSGKEFLDYDTYKSKVSSIWDEIWDKIWDTISWVTDEIGEIDLSDNVDIDVDSVENKWIEENKNVENVEKDDKSQSAQTIKSFPTHIKFVEISGSNLKTGIESGWVLTWYSKSDLLWVINKYIENNLDDDTDILVTVEYEDDSSDPQKIILQTQKKSTLEIKSDTVSSDLLNKIFDEVYSNEPESDEVSLDEDIVEDSNNQVKNTAQPVKKATSTSLTQKEKEEAEEIFWILF